MISTDSYVQDLLYDNECVIVPQFGGFITRVYPTTINNRNNTIKPKGKTIFFNSNLLNNDGLLAGFISQSKNIPYNEAVLYIQNWVDAAHQELHNKGKLPFGKLGIFYLNQEGKKWFAPDSKLNISKKSFGLETIIAQAILKEEESAPLKVITYSPKQAPVNKPKTSLEENLLPEENKTVPHWFRWVASFLLLAISGSFLYWLHINGRIHVPFIEQAAIFNVDDTVLPKHSNNQPITTDKLNNDVSKGVKVQLQTEPQQSETIEITHIDSLKIEQSSVIPNQNTTKKPPISDDPLPKSKIQQKQPQESNINTANVPNSYVSSYLKENHFTIQAGVFLHKVNANTLKKNLHEMLGLSEVFLIQSENSKMIRVYCGSFQDEAQATQQLASIKKLIPEAFIITLDKGPYIPLEQ
jgi:cell division septation protein DedD